MTDLMTRLKALTEEQEKEILLLELSRLRKKGAIDFKLYEKARRMWGI
jgi:hypothetical protein